MLVRRHLLFVVFVLLVSHVVGQTMSTAASVPTTEKLDLRAVSFVVDAQPELRDRLYSLALKQFKKAGLSMLQSEQTEGKTAILKLTLKPESLHGICSESVLYEPSLVLTEEVIVDRTEQVLKDSTWSSKQALHVRPPITIDEIEKDLEGFIGRFIVNYKMGNPAASLQMESHRKSELRKKTLSPQSLDEKLSYEQSNPSMEEAPPKARLKGLELERVSFVLWAGASSDSLYTRAVAQASKKGLKLAFRPNETTPQFLQLNFDIRPLDKACQGKFLYEASLALVEQVRIKRNPDIYVWTSTWSQYKRTITNQVSNRQLEMDVDELLGQFVDTYKSDNSSVP